MLPILECVPNFSEGRDLEKINLIALEIEKVNGVKLLHVDPGMDANRTVITFAGLPEAVVEAAFQAVKKAAEIIDMREHHGVHPRIGATDVLPLIPVQGITMEETVALSRQLSERIGTELNIPVYCYENAAFKENRRNLATCRSGEYEGLPAKLIDPEWKPDFGPSVFNARSGATVSGARDFLIAYNITLDTPEVSIAKKIAAEIRESGCKKEIVGPSGEKKIIHQPGFFKTLKAIGWYLPHYNKTQVSTNITNIREVPVHVLYEKVKELAHQYQVKVSGSELVGLIPKSIMIEAGAFYYKQSPVALHETTLIKIAVERLGLEEFVPFHLHERVLEYAMSK